MLKGFLKQWSIALAAILLMALLGLGKETAWLVLGIDYVSTSLDMWPQTWLEIHNVSLKCLFFAVKCSNIQITKWLSD